MWSFTDPFWETVFKWSTVCAAVFGAIGIASAFVSAWVGYKISDAVTQESDVKIAEAKADAKKADARALEAQLALEKFKAPRTLSDEQIDTISKSMMPFNGLRAVLGAVPPSEKNVEFMNRIALALQNAQADVSVNIIGVEAQVSPTGASRRGTLPTDGFPAGVSIFYTTGNTRATDFSKALARALNSEEVSATAVGDYRDDWVKYTMQQNSIDRNDKTFEPVIIAVGDKP